MLDFVEIYTESPKPGKLIVAPDFLVEESKDLMIKGGDFYAVWCEDRGLWSTNEFDVVRLVDKEINERYEEEKQKHPDYVVKKKTMRNGSSGAIDLWHKNVKQQRRDSYVMLNQKLVFANDPVKKEDYSSVRLKYSLEPGDYSAWDELISVLYDPKERHKIEWSIGSIITGASRTNQKFLVFYGPKGTGKSTIINVVQMLFDGYYTAFDAKALGSKSEQFALEPFKNGPLVAIQHDGDLSKIEDNTRLNSLISHELMTINEKNKSLYNNAFKTFLILGTNDPVRITNAKSGILRRLIDVSPTGHLIPTEKYDILMQQIQFQLGAIAYHCMEVYNKSPNYYKNYTPLEMMGASNEFYNFVEDKYSVFKRDDQVTAKIAWDMYLDYCDRYNVRNKLSYMLFQEELKNYFWKFDKRLYTEDGRLRNVYSGFRADKFSVMDLDDLCSDELFEEDSWLKFNEMPSLLDDLWKDCPAQYATKDGVPSKRWSSCKTTLKDLDTKKLHYVKVPDISHIVIDFDIPDEKGNKCFDLNFKEASKWPKTYAELSKSGQGIHLHYIYNGDPNELEPIYAPHIEVKVYKGDSALRRLLTKCNDIPIATISSGLPIKEGGDEVVSNKAIEDEMHLRNLIAKALRKEIPPGSTKTSMDFIKMILDDAYANGLRYDVSDMYTAILGFASCSTNNSKYCLSILDTLKFKSDEPPIVDESSDDSLWFYDIEIFPNLCLINYKKWKDDKMYRLINPKPKDIALLIRRKLVGFNCRRYDNHILYAILLGYTNDALFRLSQAIVNGDKNCFFSQAYNISYTDIYDFASSANKMSLKKLEIKMKIHHKELGFDWNQPVPPEKWQAVSEYCDNDVIATEKAFEYLKNDFMAREILATLVDGSVNDTTNQLTTKLIFGNNKTPQCEFYYRDLSRPVIIEDDELYSFLKIACPDMMSQIHTNDGITLSDLPYFPGYKFEYGTSTYKGVKVGEGGYVYATTGIHRNVALLDVASMHPHSAIAECCFGTRYTKIFRELVEARVAIKHKDWDTASQLLDGKLIPFITRITNGEISSKDLANALKTAINSVYGLTAASFANPFKDDRNVDNFIAKRGALFMIDLKEAVEKMGFTVAHIKTDSIKIPDATPEIIKFVMDFGKKYGYTFEHEATYEKMCLVNDAVYIAKYAKPEWCEKAYGYIPGDNADAETKGKYWTATGTQFQVPYVFKTLFSKEPLDFDDFCETKQVSKGALYLKNGDNYEFIGRVGQFTPMRKSIGNELLCLRDEKYVAPSGTKGYYWLESEVVRNNGLEDSIDISYYENLATEAVHTISAYLGDTFFEDFAA